MTKSKRNSAPSERLFPDSPLFRIVKLGEAAARKQTDELRTLQNMLLESEPMYPAIGRWYSEKVVPGLKTRERLAYLAIENERPVASAILKLGEHAKFCHVRIHEGFRDLNLGQMIFTQMAFQARHQSSVKDIHFTLPASLWNDKAGFFTSFGFDAAVRSSRQYRHGEDELFCSAPIDTVWERALERMHLLRRFSPGGFSFDDKILLSMQPIYAERVFSGTKRVEIRRRFPRHWRGRRAVVYGTQPLGSLMGEVTLTEITTGSPAEIWDQFGSWAGCTYDEFASYVGDCHKVFAIELSDLKPYLTPLGIAQISHLIREDLHPPQSFLDVKMNQSGPWGKAISVAGLLHSWR